MDWIKDLIAQSSEQEIQQRVDALLRMRVHEEGELIWQESNESDYHWIQRCRELASVGGDWDALATLDALRDLENPGRLQNRQLIQAEQRDALLLGQIKRHEAAYLDDLTEQVRYFTKRK